MGAREEPPSDRLHDVELRAARALYLTLQTECLRNRVLGNTRTDVAAHGTRALDALERACSELRIAANALAAVAIVARGGMNPARA